MAFADNGGNGAGVVDFQFLATDAGTSWLTQAATASGMASAMAKTYCVFVGGNVDPTAPGTKLPHGDPNLSYLE